MAVSDHGHPFYKPLWRRVAILVVILGLIAFEYFTARDPMWMTVSVGMLAYAVWTFFLNWPKDGGTPDQKT